MVEVCLTSKTKELDAKIELLYNQIGGKINRLKTQKMEITDQTPHCR